MRKTILVSVSLCVLSTSLAGAAGINLGWNDCPGGGAYALLRTFACDTNAGIHTLVGSFVAPSGVVKMSANEVVIDMATSGLTLADWWGMRTGFCRPASTLNGNWDFTAGPFTCYDYWQGGAIGGVAMNAPQGNRARILQVFAIPAGDPRITAVPEGLHVYSFKLNINSAKTVGLGSCAGCAAEACIVLQWIRLNQPVDAGPFITMSNPAVSQHVIWQAWTGQYGCPQFTPAKAKTWGSIKALYR